ncbi:flagellar assembly protein A [uncultured Helicobacter sp.]|uniref:flagellar assembly protein A n=1 Tax=uncultured Helicobacter sp. TaxID=175537 RepID=UPI002608E036|nr:flagellar assembly protein A [uncultured Helicobacter sp.]
MLKNSLHTFRPYYVNECEDIKFAIKQVSSQFGMDADSFDFELQSIVTYKKNLYDYESQLIPPQEVNKFLNNRDNMLEPNLVIQQRYCILIKEEKRRETKFHFTTDKTFSEAFLIFRAGFNYVQEDFDNVYMQIQKKKVWNKILCFNEEKEKNALEEFLKTLEYPLKQEVKYKILSGVNLIPSVEGNLEFKKDITGQFQTVLKNDVICEYQKPLQGKPGRNIRGEYIIPQSPKTLHQPCALQYDKGSIEPKEFPCCIRYVSVIGGILKYEDGFLYVRDTLETESVTLKTTGSLVGNINSGTVINITQKDAMKEALGQGMKIQAGEVNIEGNIGPNAQINSKEVRVGGFTHQNSKIYANDAEIATHKGYVKGEYIKVEMLETGIIEGKKVEVDKVYGGKIYAEEIVINTLHSNAFLYATKSIHIGRMEKGENKFFLAANYSPSGKERYEAFSKQKNESIKEAIRMTKELKVESLELKKLKATADKIRGTLIHYKNTKTTPPSYLLTRFEEYYQRVVLLKAKRQKINELSIDFKTAREALNGLDEMTKNATIVIEGGWVGYNEVHYIFYSPSRELLCIPKPGEPSKVIYQKGEIQLIL